MRDDSLDFAPSIEGNWSLLPGHIRGGIDRHIGRGEPVGDFLTAVLSNDLREAAFRADDVNRRRLRDIVLFLHNDAPAECWGSPEKVRAWRNRGGLAGRAAESEAAV